MDQPANALGHGQKEHKRPACHGSDTIRSAPGSLFHPGGIVFHRDLSLYIFSFLSSFFCFLGQRDIDELKNDCRRECRRADFSAFGLLARLCYSIEK